MLLGTATEATDGFAPLKPVSDALDELLGDLHDELTSATTDLHNALVYMNDKPTPEHSLKLRECLMKFKSLEGRFLHLAGTAEYALDMKLPADIRPQKLGR